MPAYSFQERFVPMVLDDSKPQTIRKRRKYTVEKGDRLYLYYGLRTKHCKKLREETCIDSVSVLFETNGTGKMDIIVFNRRLNDEEFSITKNGFVLYGCARYKKIKRAKLDEFAWLDGFRPDGSTLCNPAGSFELMKRWWLQTHELPFIGDLIKWAPAKPVGSILDGTGWHEAPVFDEVADGAYCD